MKISNYSVNLSSNYSSDFLNNNTRRLQNGGESLIRIHKNIDDTTIDTAAKTSFLSDEFKLTPQKNSSNINFNSLSQKTSVELEGVVKTESGSFVFNMDASLQSTHINVSSARTKDPLVIGLDGGLPTFSNAKTEFDLDGDGTKEQIATLQKGAGYLAIDKNNNGKIDDGTELIGTASGGFEELASYDDDSNGFIDENDAIYDKLKVWSKNTKEDSLKSLKDAGVGALFTESVANDYEYIIGSKTAAFLRGSSFGISEDGEAMSLSQIDLVSEAVTNDISTSTNTASEPSTQTHVEASKETGQWVKSSGKTDTESSKDTTFKDTIQSQIDRLENMHDKLTTQAQYAQTPEEAKDLTQRASMLKGQISVLKASLFKLEAVKFDETA